MPFLLSHRLKLILKQDRPSHTMNHHVTYKYSLPSTRSLSPPHDSHPALASRGRPREPCAQSSSLGFDFPGLSMPKKEDGRPWTSRSLFTKAEKEETQLPTKWSARPKMYRSIWAESGWRLTTFTWKARMKYTNKQPGGEIQYWKCLVWKTLVPGH